MEGGQWVTPREFELLNRRMDGFEAAQSEMGRDVKALLAVHNRDEGASMERTLVLGAQRDKGARRIAVGSLLASLAMAFSAIFGHPHHL